jgi:hypothetical protein
LTERNASLRSLPHLTNTDRADEMAVCKPFRHHGRLKASPVAYSDLPGTGSDKRGVVGVSTVMKGAIGWLVFSLGTLAGGPIPSNTLQSPACVPREAVPTPESSHAVGYPQSSAALLALDDRVKRYGISGPYFRSVQYVGPSGEPVSLNEGAPPSRGILMRVNYRLRREETLGSGVVVWIDVWTGETVIVTKALIRVADRAVVRAGIDLTELSRIVERDGKRMFVKYHYRGAEDGEFTVKVEPNTAKADQKIYWWDKRTGRAHFP